MYRWKSSAAKWSTGSRPGERTATCEHLWITRRGSIHGATCGITALHTIHKPYYYNYKEQEHLVVEEDTVKFRCERDTLADAVATAQRTVASRSGALPVLQDLRVTASDDGLELIGSDLEITNRVRVPAEVEESGVAVIPKMVGDIVRKLEPGPVTIVVEGDEAKITAGRFSTSLRLKPAEDYPRLAPPDGSGVRVDAAAFASALRQVVRAASKDDLRPILTGVLLTAHTGGLRLVATDSYRLAVRDLAGVSMLEEGQRVLVAAKGLAEVQRLAGDGEIEVVLRTNDVVFRTSRAEVTARLIEGDFPNYEQLIPSGYPNRLTVEREALLDALDRVQIVGQNRDNAAVRLAMSAEGLELSMSAQDVGNAQETLDAKFEGVELTCRVQPGVPARRCRSRRRGRGLARDDRPAEAGDTAGGRRRRLPVPADARTNVLRYAMQAVADSAPATSVTHLWLTDFRCIASVDIELAPTLTVLDGANGQGKTSLLEAIAWVARTRSFRGVADAMLVRSGTEQAVVRAEVAAGDRRQLFEAEIRATGRNRILCNRQTVTRARDLHGLLRVTVFSPDDLALVKGGPAERRVYLDELLGTISARYEAARTDFERVLKQRNALLRGGVRDEEARTTLDVFDEQLVRSATEVVRGRLRLADRLVPVLGRGYAELSGAAGDVRRDLRSGMGGRSRRCGQRRRRRARIA